jgi:hypothetical protein
MYSMHKANIWGEITWSLHNIITYVLRTTYCKLSAKPQYAKSIKLLCRISESLCIHCRESSHKIIYLYIYFYDVGDE